MDFFIENAEIKYHWGFILLKLWIKWFGCELIQNKEDVWTDFIENAEIKYQCGFILLKFLIKITAVNSFKRKKSWGFFSLKMLKSSKTRDLFC